MGATMVDEASRRIATFKPGLVPGGSRWPTDRPVTNLDFSLIISLYDEAENVAPLIEEIVATLDGRYAYEIVCVDDGSRDGTLQALKAAAAQHPNLVVLYHHERCGKSAGVFTGAQAARAPVLVLMDGDRQNDPADVPQVLTALADGSARDPRLVMVAGQRMRRADSLLRKFSSRLANGVRRVVLRDGTRDTGCALKAITREAFLALPFFDGQHRFMSALVQAQGGRIALCDVSDRPRAAGQAKYGVWNRLWVGIGDLLAVSWLTRRCHRPSRVERVVAGAEAKLEEGSGEHMG